MNYSQQNGSPHPNGRPTGRQQNVPPGYQQPTQEQQQWNRPNGQPGGYQPGYPPPQEPHREPRRQSRRRSHRRGCSIGPGCIFGCIGLVGVLVMSFLITSWAVYAHYSNKLEDNLNRLDKISGCGESFETTTILDRQGQELYEVLGEGRRTCVDLDQVSQDLIDATISVEDDTFYDNIGIDVPSIARAAKQYVQAGDVVSGGSTITQQVIRNILFSYQKRNERTINRKIEEALLAVVMTQRKSKDEILTLYLNNIYYGNLAYGIEAASETYFGKHASELTLAEASLLAGLPQAPADLDPLNPDPGVQMRVMERRRLVLDLMVEEDYITQAEADAAFAEPLNFVSPNIDLDSAPHFVVYARDQLEDLLMTQLGLNEGDIRRGGLRVYTTIDMDIQRLAEQTVQAQVSQLINTKNMHNAALVVLQPDTGEILAMVGSVNYNDESIDGNVNVTIAARQPGSAMKPFTYSAAMEKGYTAATIIWDTETHIGIEGQEQYSPHNYDNSWHGPVRVREALANSYNIPAVQTLRQIGVDYLLWMMNRVGVTSLENDPSRYGLSLTLGGGEVTPLELTNAYAVLANGGVYVPSTPILCVTNSKKQILYEYEDGCPSDATLTDKSVSVIAQGQQVMDPRIAFIISDILADNNARSTAMGSNSPLYTPGIPTSVKTGTTNDFRDNWTVGFTRNVAIGVWAGNTDNTPMVNVSGIEGAAPIWNQVMNAIYSSPDLHAAIGSLPDDGHLQPPGGVIQQQICNASRGNLQDPATGCPPSITEWFLDSPPLVPDGNGGMVQAAPAPQPEYGSTGPQPVEVQPSVIRVAVFPVSPDYANAIAANDVSGHTVPPRYCQVPIEVAGQVPGVQDQFFIAPPPDEQDAFYARLWAQANGVAILPQFACNSEMLSAPMASIGGGGGPQVVVANITSPTPGQGFSSSQQIDIVGSAVFSPDQAAYYKVEIQGGPYAGFTTLGDVNNWKNRSGVSNDVLESIMAGGLPRLVHRAVGDRRAGWQHRPAALSGSVQRLLMQLAARRVETLASLELVMHFTLHCRACYVPTNKLFKKIS